MKYEFREKDFENAFEFAVKYYFDPSKAPSGRTSAEPRGLGAVLDAFTRGKLVEIGAQKMLESLNPKKQYLLDFAIKSTRDVTDEPDVIKIARDGGERDPRFFIEIKSTSITDRWIGLTEEQLATMKRASKGKQIFNIYLSLNTKLNTSSPRSADFVGMYLKYISDLPLFGDFDDLNAYAGLEFIISAEELEKYGVKFSAGNLMYETELFQGPFSMRKHDGALKSGIKLIKSYDTFSKEIPVPRKDGTIDKDYGIFSANGSFSLYIKRNPKTQTNFIECSADTTFKNEVFGIFHLQKGNAYRFNLETLGSDPILKRNNIFIAKRRVYQLIEDGVLPEPNSMMKIISEEI